MRASNTGYILTLIGGILTLAIAVVPLLIFIFLIFGGAVVQEFLGRFVIPLQMLVVLAFLVFLLIVGIGILKLYAAKLMKDKKTTLTGGIIGFILGILSSDLFSMVGGVFGIVQGSK